jgi:hypothetical protein
MRSKLEKRFEWLREQATSAMYLQGEYALRPVPSVVADAKGSGSNTHSPMLVVLKFAGTLVLAFGLSLLIRAVFASQIIPAYSGVEGLLPPDETQIQVTGRPGYWAQWGLVIHFTGICVAGIALMRKTLVTTLKQLPQMLNTKKLKALAALK